MNLLKDNVPRLVQKLALPAMVGTLFQCVVDAEKQFLQMKGNQKNMKREYHVQIVTTT